MVADAHGLGQRLPPVNWNNCIKTSFFFTTVNSFTQKEMGLISLVTCLQRRCRRLWGKKGPRAVEAVDGLGYVREAPRLLPSTCT